MGIIREKQEQLSLSYLVEFATTTFEVAVDISCSFGILIVMCDLRITKVKRDFFTIENYV